MRCKMTLFQQTARSGFSGNQTRNVAWGVSPLQFFTINDLPRLKPGFKLIGFEQKVRIARTSESALLLGKCLIKHKPSGPDCLFDPVYQSAVQVIEYQDSIKSFASQRVVRPLFKIHFPQPHHSGIGNIDSAEARQFLTINVGENHGQAPTEEIAAVATRAAGKIEDAVGNLERFQQSKMLDE